MSDRNKITVPIARVALSREDINSVLEPLSTGWLVQGPKVKAFEDGWSDFTGASKSIAVTSCTSGLHLALLALGVGPGDEVIVPAFTWVSSANVVEHVGATVVFCDIDLLSFNIDPVELEKKISSNTKAIIAVHLFGMPADMDLILELADIYSIAVVEDAACGFGARYKGRHVGVFGDAGVFSFHPRKALTTGEGGMVTTNQPLLDEKLRKLRDHGAGLSDLQRHNGPAPYLLADHDCAGFNCRLTDIQASLGLAQLTRASDILAERKNIARRYAEAFQQLDWLRVPQSSDVFHHGYQSFPCLLCPDDGVRGVPKNNIRRNSWMQKLFEAGVSTRPATHAVHMLSFYAKKYNLIPNHYPNAFVANDTSVSLPLFNGLTERELEHVIDVVSTVPF